MHAGSGVWVSKIKKVVKHWRLDCILKLEPLEFSRWGVMCNYCGWLREDNTIKCKEVDVVGGNIPTRHVVLWACSINVSHNVRVQSWSMNNQPSKWATILFVQPMSSVQVANCIHIGKINLITS